MHDSLDGRRVVVTGAGGRLGRVLVETLHARGAHVAALGRHGSDVPHVAYHDDVDLADEAAVTDAFARLADTFGRPDALVHVVGAWDGQPLLETTLADWDALVRVNLTTAFLCIREGIRAMQGGRGRIVALASRQGADRGVARQGAYSASKAGVIRLVEAVAAEYQGQDVTAVAVAPSTILYGDEAPGAAGVPADRLAALCAHLCTDAGADYTGSVVRLYGPTP